MTRWAIAIAVLAGVNALLGAATGAVCVVTKLRGAAGILVVSCYVAAMLVGWIDAARSGQVMGHGHRLLLALLTLPLQLAGIRILLPYDIDPQQATLFWGLVALGGALHLAITTFSLGAGAKTYFVRQEVKRLEEDRNRRPVPPLLSSDRRLPFEPGGNGGKRPEQ